MDKLKSILLLVIMGIVLFPWQMVCVAHPSGHSHEHHEPGKPSACEMHRLVANEPGQHILPPMHCKHIASQVDDFQQPQVEKITLTFQTFAILAVLFDLPYSFRSNERPYLFPPEAKCRSATLISNNPLRGPPLA